MLTKQTVMPFLKKGGLVACASGSEEDSNVNSGVSNSQNESVSISEQTVLIDSYDDALFIQAQLALGILQMEGTGLAVSGVQAETLLPF